MYDSTHVHTYMRVCTYTYVYTYIHIYIHVCMYTCVCLCTAWQRVATMKVRMYLYGAKVTGYICHECNDPYLDRCITTGICRCTCICIY